MDPQNKKELLELYRKHPMSLNLDMGCIVFCFAGVILFYVLQGLVVVQFRYFILTILHLAGAAAGLASIQLTPAEIKAINKQGLLRTTLLANLGFFLLCGFRFWALMVR